MRAAFYQLILLAAVLWFGYEFALNAKANLEARQIASGFGFLNNTAGFGVNQTLIAYNEADSYGRVFVVGLLNTLLVAGIGIVLATILGFLIGIARLSPNWLVARLGGRLCRADPQLAAAVPDPVLVSRRARHAARTAPEHLVFSARFFSTTAASSCPRRWPATEPVYVMAASALGLIATIALEVWSRRRQDRTGQRFPLLWTGLTLIVALPLIVLVATGFRFIRETRTARVQFRRRDQADP